jgi:gas vesicle protein
MAERDDFGAFLIGFVVGALTGAAVSLLLAPQSGEETRALIKDKAIEIGEKTSDTLDEAYLRAQKTANDAQVRANEIAKLIKEQAEDLQKRGQAVFEEQRSRIGDVIENARKSASRNFVEVPNPPETPAEN